MKHRSSSISRRRRALSVVVAAAVTAVYLFVLNPVSASAAPDTSAWYLLQSRSSGLVLDIDGASTANGAELVQWNRTNAHNQQFRFVDSGGGYYRIQARHSGKVLDVWEWNADNGATIAQYDDQNGTNQQWQVQESGGYVTLVNRFSGKALDVWKASTTSGDRISQYTPNGGTNQQFQLIRTDTIDPPADGPMLTGGDITYRRMTTEMGGRWADSTGEEKDVLDILADKGFNIARIRIYNEPGNDVNGMRLQPGWQDLADAVQNAQDAKARGMKIFITIYYSDFWWNNEPPAAWQSYSQSELEAAAYDWTREVMTTMQDNGVTPDYVTIGNEMGSEIAGVSRSEDPAGYYEFLKQAVAGVRSVSSTTQTAVHLRTSSGLPHDVFTDWIEGAATYGLDYDVLGMTLYPFYTNSSIGSMADFASWASDASGRPVMVVEVGYPWTLDAQHPEAGELTLIEAKGADPDGPENYGATPAGQKRYLQEYFRAMNDTGDVVAVVYWDPIWLDLEPGADPNGWIVGGDVEVEDTSLFNYDNPHVATAGLDAFNTW